jgi:hypothetical protein
MTLNHKEKDRESEPFDTKFTRQIIKEEKALQ